MMLSLHQIDRRAAPYLYAVSLAAHSTNEDSHESIGPVLYLCASSNTSVCCIWA